MSSELFESREEDFKTIYSDARHKLTEQIPKCSGELQKKQIRDVERIIEEANILIQEMESEMRKAPPAFRTQMISNVRIYKRDVEQLTRDLKRVSNTRLDPNRGDFGYASEQSVEAAQRYRLMQGTEHLTRASESLARTHQIAAETDQVGTEIIEELGTQRESLLRTKTRLTETDENLSQSRKVVNIISRRVMTNKLLLVIVILIELGILGGVIYWKFFSGKKKNG
jgi:vesicle transport through interaction with t-SNAREs protein 1